MGVMDAGAAAIKGLGDKFDQTLALFRWLEESVRNSYPIEFHPGDGPIPEGWEEAQQVDEETKRFLVELLGENCSDHCSCGKKEHIKPHFFDPAEHWMEQIQQARRKIRETEHTFFQVLSEI